MLTFLRVCACIEVDHFYVKVIGCLKLAADRDWSVGAFR